MEKNDKEDEMFLCASAAARATNSTAPIKVNSRSRRRIFCGSKSRQGESRSDRSAVFGSRTWTPPSADLYKCADVGLLDLTAARLWIGLAQHRAVYFLLQRFQ